MTWRQMVDMLLLTSCTITNRDPEITVFTLRVTLEGGPIAGEYYIICDAFVLSICVVKEAWLLLLWLIIVSKI